MTSSMHSCQVGARDVAGRRVSWARI